MTINTRTERCGPRRGNIDVSASRSGRRVVTRGRRTSETQTSNTKPGRRWHRLKVGLAISLCLLVTGLVAAAPAQTPRTWQFGQLTLHACELAQDGTSATVAAWCGQFAVPENRAVPDGRSIRLNLAVLRSRSGAPATDVVALLAGGPGQAATRSYLAEAGALSGLRDDRHILLVDQRGTGGSNALACPDVRADEPLRHDPTEIARATRRCLAQVRGHADPRFYTTTAAVADLEAVRAALAIPALDLVGVSYGTRVAQQYAGAHAARTRSMVLDGVVPNTVYLGQNVAVNLDAALAAWFGQCRATPACRQRFGNPAATLTTLSKRLAEQPVPVAYRNPRTFVPEQRELNADTLAAVVRLFAYTPETAALIPWTLARAAHGDTLPLMAQAALVTKDLQASLDVGMGLSVSCTEDAAGLSRQPANTATVLGQRLVDALQTQCAIWPHDAAPADFHAPLVSDIPTLLVSGARDPVTPPAYARRVAEHLSQADSVILAGAGHNNIARGCMPHLLADFIDAPATVKLETGCLDRLRALPIFTDANGAAP